MPALRRRGPVFLAALALGGSAEVFASGLSLDRAGLDAALRADGPVVLPGVALDGRGEVTLELERFRITTPATRFVAGPAGRRLPFDPDRVILLRGHVRDVPGSHAFVALTEWAGLATLEAPALGRATLRGPGPRATGGAGWQLSQSAAALLGALPPGTRFCAVAGRDAPVPAGGPALSPITQQVELAVDTDFEFAQLFGADLDAAAAYVMAVYGAVCDICLRDIDTRVVLSFVRLWDADDDPYGGPNPLAEFQAHWAAKMGAVHRDVAQYFSGRRDFPYGGAAFLSALCGGGGYSVVGYALGFFDDPSRPGIHQYDIHVTAHELGHNFGAFHTHDYGLDNCQDLFGGPARRGSIMSYCSQTRSGGNANTDLRFHTRVQDAMRAHVFAAACIAEDCNGNGVPDDEDIAAGRSLDTDADGVPDECEDCNGNGTLDDADIAAGESLDLNANGIPDECEPDCNGNGIPDDLEIADGTVPDLYGNGIPDGCERDDDGDGLADYSQILANMALDRDRDTVLDAVQDCDGDGLTDLDALDGAHSVWVAGAGSGATVHQFHPTTGVLMRTGVNPGGPRDLLVTPDRRILVSYEADNRIVEFSAEGAYGGDFVPAGSGGLSMPGGLALSPGGTLVVASMGTDSVLEYDGATGAFVGALVPPGSGTLEDPFGVAFGPNGNLYVTSREGRVLEYDAASGAFLGEFVSAADNGGLIVPRGMLWLPGGNLLVASMVTNRVLEYDGATGAFVRQFNDGGTDQALTMDAPWGLRLGPDGNVYVSRHGTGPGGGGGGHDDGDIQHLHINSTRIYVFHPTSGIFLRSYVLGHDTGLWQPTGFDFLPDAGTDCNANQVPDPCDIAAGTSADVNADGVPDECQFAAGDLDADGMVSSADLLLLLAGWGPCPDPPAACPGDLDASGAVTHDDLEILLANWG